MAIERDMTRHIQLDSNLIAALSDLPATIPRLATDRNHGSRKIATLSRETLFV